jgi:hypothetical protein
MSNNHLGGAAHKAFENMGDDLLDAFKFFCCLDPFSAGLHSPATAFHR